MVESLNILDIDDAINRLQDELSIVSTKETNLQRVKKESLKEEPIKAEPKEQQQEPIEPASLEPEPKVSAQSSDMVLNAEAKFKTLQDKIYDRNYDLGEIFSRCVSFVSFEDNTLTWESSANEEEKKALRNSWSIIKLFVEEVFGIGVKIKSTQKKTQLTKQEPKTAPNDSPKEEQKSSCIMPEGNSEASIDKDPQELLNEPMIKSFLETFEPKRVIVKQKT